MQYRCTGALFLIIVDLVVMNATKSVRTAVTCKPVVATATKLSFLLLHEGRCVASEHKTWRNTTAMFLIVPCVISQGLICCANDKLDSR